MMLADVPAVYFGERILRGCAKTMHRVARRALRCSARSLSSAPVEREARP